MTHRDPSQDPASTTSAEPPQPPEFQPGAYEAPARMSPSQQMAHAMNSIEPRSLFCIIFLGLRMRGHLDEEAMITALRTLVDRHRGLRTVFPVVDGRPVPTVQEDLDLEIPVVDLRDLSAEERLRSIDQLRSTVASTPFDLERGPLVRFQIVRLEDEYAELMVSGHHIVCDAWSRGVMILEVQTSYAALVGGRTATFGPAIPYSDYAAWQASWLAQDGVSDQLRDHWRERLRGWQPLELPTSRERTAFRSWSTGSICQTLPQSMREGLAGLRKAERLSPFDVLFTAYNLVLGHLAGTEDVGVTVPFANRPTPQHFNVVGFMANPVLLRTDLSDAADFRELLGRVKQTKRDAKRWQGLPFVHVGEVLDERTSPDALGRAWFDLVDVSRGAPKFPGLEVEWTVLPGSFAALDVMLAIMIHGDSIELQWIYSEALFDHTVVARMTESFFAVLSAMLADLSGHPRDVAWPGRVLGSESDEASMLHAAALSIEQLTDAHVVERTVDPEAAGLEARTEWCVYAAAERAMETDRLEAMLADVLERVTRPVTFCMVTCIPRDDRGRVDEVSLASVPVHDGWLAARWQAAIGEADFVADVEVAPQQTQRRPAALHLDAVAPATPTPSRAASDPAVLPSTQTEPAPSGPLAVVDGGPLEIPPGAPVTFTEALQRAAQGPEERGMVYVGLDGQARRQSYRELLHEARRVRTGIARAGFGPGRAVVLQIADAHDYYPVFWGCVLSGLTPVTVAIPPVYERDNAVVAKLLNTWELLERPPIVASQTLCESLGRLSTPDSPLRILSADELRDHAPDEPIHEAKPDDVMFFQLTSGSTGTPKCIQETHAGIIRHIHGSALECDYRSDDVCLNWLARDHVVPILTFHLKGVYLGCQQVELPIQMVLADPLRWLDHLESHRVTHTWAPNFGFKKVVNALAEQPERRWDLSSMKYFMNAGEQVTRTVMRDFVDALAPFGVSANAMQPAFGMAEVCTCMTYENGFELERSAPFFRKSSLSGRLQPTTEDDPDAISFVMLGPPMPGVSIRITDTNNEPVPQGVIGRLQIKGGVVTPGYLSNPEANREAFVGDGWFNTGDLGFIYEGHMAITGREKEMIIINGANHYCYELEDIVDRIEGVEPSFVAACGIADETSGTEELALFFTPSAPGDATAVEPQLLHTIQSTVAQSTGVRPAHVLPVERARFPKTTSGKIQRSALKKRFISGEFAALQRTIDVAMENERTVPAWFFARRWQPVALDGPRQSLDGRTVLVFADEAEVAEPLSASLRDRGARVVTVRRGSQFESADPTAYTLDPTDGEHYDQLWRSVQDAGAPVNEVLYLWTYDPGASERGGGLDDVSGLLRLLQAAARSRAAQPSLAVRVVTRHVFNLAEGPEPTIEHGSIPGLLGAAARENPWLAAAIIDLPGTHSTPQTVQAALLQELERRLRPARLEQSLWRDDRRYGPRLEAVAPAPPTPDGSIESPLRTGGAYVISGGLGDLAVALAERLLRRYQARLLLLGRSSADDPDLGARLERLRRLGEVRYAAVDVADERALEAAAESACSEWGLPLDGVFHLAGTFHQRAVLDETPASIAAALRTKLGGARALASLLKDRPGALFASYSSVNGTFPGSTVGAYAAANGVLDRFSDQLRRRGYRSLSLAWTSWRGQGVSRATPQLEDLAGYAGYRLLGLDEGLTSLEVALALDESHVLIGLDAGTSAIATHLLAPPRPSLDLVARVETSDDMPRHAVTQRVDELVVRDRYGTPSRCTVALGGAASGEGDRTSTEAQGPQTPMERKIAAIWCEVLELDSVDVHADVFALGGSSVAAAAIFGKLQQLAGRELSIAELFQHRTIHQLAEHLDG